MRIDIRGVIVPNDDKGLYDFFGIENTTPGEVAEALAKAKGQPVDVYINSTGGEVFSGSDIYSMLREYQGKVKIHIVGLAASAASVIAMAGESEISPTGALMVHNVSSMARGDYRTMEKEAEVLKELNRAIANAYCNKAGMTEEEALEMMNKETWLTANSAVEKGLIDSIMFQSRELAAAAGTGLLSEDEKETARKGIAAAQQKKENEVKTKIQILRLKGEKSK